NSPADVDRRIREIGVVENVVDFTAQLDAESFASAEFLPDTGVQLTEVGTVQDVVAQIAKAAGGRDREASRIQPETGLYVRVRITAGDRIGTLQAARLTTARYVDHGHRGRSAVGKYRAGGVNAGGRVEIQNVIALHQDVHRESRVDAQVAAE